MKKRSWSLLMLAGLLLVWAVPAFAVSAGSDDPSRIVRQTEGKGVMLEVTVLDTKGRPVTGADITAVHSNMSNINAKTGPGGLAVLDGLPSDSKGTLHAITRNKQSLRTVNWDILVQSGYQNRCTIRYYTICERNPLVVKLPTPGRPNKEMQWDPVSYVGAKLPVRKSRFIQNEWQELTFYPHGKGVITLAYARPWEWAGKPKPLVTDWYLAVYTVVKCPPRVKPQPAPVVQPAAQPAPVAAPAAPVEQPAAAPAE